MTHTPARAPRLQYPVACSPRLRYRVTVVRTGPRTRGSARFKSQTATGSKNARVHVLDRKERKETGKSMVREFRVSGGICDSSATWRRRGSGRTRQRSDVMAADA